MSKSTKLVDEYRCKRFSACCLKKKYGDRFSSRQAFTELINIMRVSKSNVPNTQGMIVSAIKYYLFPSSSPTFPPDIIDNMDKAGKSYAINGFF
ncbi:MAG: hypothetical protein KC413_15280, partial [Anaerolineales bacterium]|nr:hypothetical protein [Anaerolineales bacterium]